MELAPIAKRKYQHIKQCVYHLCKTKSETKTKTIFKSRPKKGKNKNNLFRFLDIPGLYLVIYIKIKNSD